MVFEFAMVHRQCFTMSIGELSSKLGIYFQQAPVALNESIQPGWMLAFGAGNGR